MRLYLVQHGSSASEAEDPRRPLNEAGRRHVQKLAVHISQFSLAIDVIEHSDKLRAQQTAEVLDLQLRPGLGSKQVEGLGPTDPVGPLAERLRSEQKDVMLVGHLPHLNTLANQLLGLKAGDGMIYFQMGGCVCLERNDAGRWGSAGCSPPTCCRKKRRNDPAPPTCGTPTSEAYFLFFSRSSTAATMMGRPTVASTNTSPNLPPSAGGTNFPQEMASL